MASVKELFLRLIFLGNLKISEGTKGSLLLKIFFVAAASGIFYFYDDHFVQFFWMNFISKFIFFYVVLDLVISFLRALIVSRYRKQNKVSKETTDNFILGITTISRILLFFGMILFILYFFRVGLRTFITSFGLVSVAFAWIFKEYLSNIMDGIIIMFSKDFQVRNYIKFNDIKGRIRTIKFLNTEIYTDEGDIVYVPNTTIVSNNVVNYSKAKDKRIMISFSISKEYFKKAESLEKHLVKIVKSKFKDLLTEEDPYITINTIEGKKAEVTLEVPVTTYSFALENDMKKMISLELLKFFSK